MATLTDQPAPAVALSGDGRVEQFSGEVVYLYAFDLAYEMVRKPLQRLMGQAVTEFAVAAGKHGPRQLLFYRPQMVRLPPQDRVGPQGPVQVQREIKLMPIGAISITVRVPFSCRSLEELVKFHDLQFGNGGWLYDEVRELAEQVRRELAPLLLRPVEKLADEEAYTVFCINGPLRTGNDSEISTENWLANNRRLVAALLTEESEPRQLSEQEAVESTGRYFTYYQHDLLVLDWDAAIVIDDPKFFNETLFVMELANLQLAELEAYDRILDAAVERSYRDVTVRRFRGLRPSKAQGELREIRIDMARMSDELSNITKFFGDWHLARIYQALSDRFHLADWHRTIDEKLKTLDDLYQLIHTEQANRWMLFLECSMAVLFVVDVVLVVMGLRK